MQVAAAVAVVQQLELAVLEVAATELYQALLHQLLELLTLVVVVVVDITPQVHQAALA
jgi:hypothetical protein